MKRAFLHSLVAGILLSVVGCQTSGSTVRDESPGPAIADGAVVSENAKALPPYDAEVIDRIMKRWHQMVAEMKYTALEPSEVIVEFRLHRNGAVTRVNIAKNSGRTVLGLVAANAIQESAPFQPWPPEMRANLSGQSYRELRITFRY